METATLEEGNDLGVLDARLIERNHKLGALRAPCWSIDLGGASATTNATTWTRNGRMGRGAR